MEVTISSPTVTIEPGPDGLPVVVNMGASVVVGIVLDKRLQGTLVDVTNPTGYTTVEQYLVQIDLYNRRLAEIPMGRVENQVTWTNDEAGALQAQSDIIAAIP